MTKDRAMQIAADMIARVYEFEEDYFLDVMEQYVERDELIELGFENELKELEGEVE